MAELTLDDIKTLKGDTREFNVSDPFIFYLTTQETLQAVIISSVALLVSEKWRVSISLKSHIFLQVYDYLLTFADERRLVWPSRLSLMKVIFFCNRYLPFVASIGMMYS